ncbi:MAG: hypothetical protein BGO70_18330 [Bacteroidetes bacterium 43-93]|nr:MAG: hypothetical protein BGO70_18330 [Bacteroidetes bacterium 43-93]
MPAGLHGDNSLLFLRYKVNYPEMKKNLLYILAVVFVFASCAKPSYQYPAVFGERMDKWMRYERVVRIFMDKEGLYYPEYFISDKELRQKKGSLREWYKAHPKAMSAIRVKYGINDSTGSIDDNIERIDDAVARSYIRAINTMAHDNITADILIHGFRKKAYGTRFDFNKTSRRDFGDLEDALLAGTKKDVLFIEVYWDANDISGYKGAKKINGIFYHNTIPSAMNVGLKLRKVVPMIDKKLQINIVSQDIGARVASELLFNASGGFMQGEAVYNTPAQKEVNVYMIAPAISSSLFENYNNRNPFAPVTGDNYKLNIIYNENDLVDNKKVKAGPFKSGNLSPADSGATTLGCNYEGDIDKLKGIIKQPDLKTYDLSKKGHKKQKCSAIKKCYIDNTASFAQVTSDIGDWATYVPPAPPPPKDKRRGLGSKRTAPERTVLTKEEKEKLKADKKAKEKLAAKKKAEAEKERMEERRQAEKERMETQRQKNEDKRLAEQAKRDAARQKEADRKAAEKQKALAAKEKDEERRMKEKERAAEAKQRAQERKDREKQRAEEAKQKEKERKEREKQRAAEAKQRAEERKQQAREKAEAAREAAKEKERARKEQERMKAEQEKERRQSKK